MAASKKYDLKDHPTSPRGPFSLPKTFLVLLGIVLVTLWWVAEWEDGSLCINAPPTLQSKSYVAMTMIPSGSSIQSKILTSAHEEDKEGGYIISLREKNFTCLPSYSIPFRNVLVIMQFTARLGTVEKEVEEIYSCFFPNIKRYTLGCDPNDAEATAGGMNCVPDPTPTFAQGHWLTYNPSWFQYDILVDAMEKYPTGYDAYFFMQEDLITNFWNYPARHDFNKVWRNLIFADPDPEVWHLHANLSLTYPENIVNFATLWTRTDIFPIEHIREFVDGFSTEEKVNLYQTNSITGEASFRMANSDIYYVPIRYKDGLLKHLKRARQHMIFHEVAMPITFDAILQQDEYEELIGGAVFRVEDSVEKFALYDPCWDYMHKFKTSKKREFEWLREQVWRYGPMMASWDCLDSGKEGLTSYFRIRDTFP